MFQNTSLCLWKTGGEGRYWPFGGWKEPRACALELDLLSLNPGLVTQNLVALCKLSNFSFLICKKGIAVTYLCYFEDLDCDFQRPQNHAWYLASASGFVLLY